MIFVKVLAILCGGKEQVWTLCMCNSLTLSPWWDRRAAPLSALPLKEQQQFRPCCSRVPGLIAVP